MATQPCPSCGWVNRWTDSGDRGLAEAEHRKACHRYVTVEVGTTDLFSVRTVIAALKATVVEQYPQPGAAGYTVLTIERPDHVSTQQ